MKIAVVGLWHLGIVTAVCLAAEGNDVCAVDDAAVVAEIAAGRLPVDEPGLGELIAENVAAGRLRFGADARDARGAELIWICYDTPVNDDDRTDAVWVMERTLVFLAAFTESAVVAVSSQLPAGSLAELERRAPPGFAFACIPENLRLGGAIAYFRRPDRFVAGVRGEPARSVVERALAFAPAIVWTTIESAEVVKHAINAFLATSVVFANEIAAVCERTGADAREVERGLKSDVRIGAKAYVRAGEAFAGGTLMRDLTFLRELGSREGIALLQLRATAESNVRHRDWVFERLVGALGSPAGRRIALLGLVYKPGTDTLRASNAVALARKLCAAGADIVAYDPAIAVEDGRLCGLATLERSAEAALADADAAVVATSWPQFREIDPLAFTPLRERIVVDQSRFLEAQLAALVDLTYIAFGRPVAPQAASR